MKNTAHFKFLRETLQKPGIFYKILGTLVFLALIITLLVAVFLSNLLSENKSEQIDEISILRLEQAAETLETAFHSMESSMNNLHWNSDFVSFSVNPEETDISRDQSILQTMGYMYLNDLTEELYFISCYSDQVFTARGDILSREEEEVSVLWKAYRELDLSGTAVSEVYTRNGLFLDETGELYLCSELVVGNPISVLICRIDREAMSHMLRTDSEEPDSYLCIFDEKGHALLEDCYTYWCTGTELEDSSLFMQSGEDAERSNIYYLYVSATNGWYYVS
ncbi:MAG: cache domain-containing protein, partial [Lachnospiraceae bacterium]|nr:cache domain-containing protein [Lachnospiraceae bacterium]